MKKSSYLALVVISILFVVIVGPNIVSRFSSIDGKSIEELTIKNSFGKSIYSFDGIPYTGRIYEYDSLSVVLLIEFTVLEGIYEWSLSMSIIQMDLFYVLQTILMEF